MVDEQRRIRRLRACADIPPELFAQRLALRNLFLFQTRRHGAPQIRTADQTVFNLLRQHAADAGRIFFQFAEAVHHELVVLRIGLVKPINIRLVQPSFLLQMGLDFAKILFHQLVVLRRAFRIAHESRIDTRMERAAAQARDIHLDGVEMVFVERLLHGLVPFVPMEDKFQILLFYRFEIAVDKHLAGRAVRQLEIIDPHFARPFAGIRIERRENRHIELHGAFRIRAERFIERLP